jgi:hypothetical protein
MPKPASAGFQHKPRSRNRGFQLMRSRRSKFGGFDHIINPNFPPMLERRLGTEDVGFP